MPLLPTLLSGSKIVAFLTFVLGGPCNLCACAGGGPLSARLREEKLDLNRCARLLNRPLDALAGRGLWCLVASDPAAERVAGEGTCIDIGRARVLCGVAGAGVEAFTVAGLAGGGNIVFVGAALAAPPLPGTVLLGAAEGAVGWWCSVSGERGRAFGVIGRMNISGLDGVGLAARYWFAAPEGYSVTGPGMTALRFTAAWLWRMAKLGS